MSDIPATPPVPPSTTASPQNQTQTQTQAQADNSSAASPAIPAAVLRALQNLAVSSAPKQLQNPQTPVRVEGTVASRDAETGQVRVSTPQGDIVVQTRAPLPEGADVTVELYMQATKEMANISVQRRQDDMAQQAVEQIAPKEPPPLKEGQQALGLFLPEDEQAQYQAPPRLPLEAAARVAAKLTPEIIAQLPRPPVEAGILEKIATAPDPLKELQSLSPRLQEKITEFLARPAVLALTRATGPAIGFADKPVTETAPEPFSTADILRKLVTSYLPQSLRKTAAPAQAGATPAPNPQQTATSTAPQAARQEDPATALFRALMPFLEQEGAAQKAAAPLQGLPQNLLQVKILSVLLPGQKPAPETAPKAEAQQTQARPAQPQAAQIRTGTIEEITPRGFPVIRTEEGRFLLRLPVTAPLGAKVVFETTPATPETLAARAPAAPGAALPEDFNPLTASTWPALEEALQAVSVHGGAAAHTLRDAVPAPSQKFTPAALLFLAALRMGEVESWLGDAAPGALRAAGRKSLVEKLSGDFGRLADQAKDILPGGWKMISMPLLHDEHISQLRFFVRHQNEREAGEDAGDGKPATRFLLNLTLSRMGEMQMDGYIHKKRLDLILRTREALPFSMRQEIMQRCAAGLSQAQLQGGISFQTRHENWVTIDLPAHKGTVA